MPGDRVSLARERPDAYGAFRVHPELGAPPSDSASLALDPSTNATVLVQTLHLRDERQRKDAAILSALSSVTAVNAPHRSVALPIAAGLEERVPYVVYSNPAGVTIDALVHDRGAQPLAAVVRSLLPVASAIDLAAAAGMHHGALTPSDIFVTGDGAVTVTRFGLVDSLKQVELDIAVEPSFFASHDRADGAAPALADDVYSLAAIALYMIAGHTRDMNASREEDRFRDVGPEWTPPLSHAEEQILKTIAGADSRLLQSALARALSPDPAARQPRAIELVNELRHAIVEERPRREAVNNSLRGFVSERPEHSARPKVAHMIRPTAPPVVPRPPAAPTAPLALRPPGPPAREPMRRPATLMSDAVPVVHPRRLKRNIALALLVAGSIGAAFASGVLVGTPDDVIPSFPATRTDAPVRKTPPPPQEPLTNQSPTDPRATMRSGAPVAESPAAVAAGETGVQPPPVPSRGEPATSVQSTIEPGASRAAPAEQRPGRPAAPPAAAVDPNTPGTLFATSRPTHAQLFVDDLLVGTMPLLMSGLSPGTHRIRVELAGWNAWSSSVQIEPGQRFNLEVTLDRSAN